MLTTGTVRPLFGINKVVSLWGTISIEFRRHLVGESVEKVCRANGQKIMLTNSADKMTKLLAEKVVEILTNC